jgi:hypothetical protein
VKKLIMSVIHACTSAPAADGSEMIQTIIRIPTTQLIILPTKRFTSHCLAKESCRSDRGGLAYRFKAMLADIELFSGCAAGR